MTVEINGTGWKKEMIEGQIHFFLTLRGEYADTRRKSRKCPHVLLQGF